MRRSVGLTSIVGCWVVLGSCISVATAQMRPHVVPEGPLSPQEQLQKFHLPPGFEIELVASEPEIYSPLSINFDKQGRLWVTDTIEYPFPPKGPGRDGLKVFEDTDGDGRYDTCETLIDKLSMPTGAEPIPGGAIVFSVPSILGCYDTTGDGDIDSRKILYTEFGNLDAHGMNNGFTRWLDGWIYACHGYANTSEVKGSDGQSITMNSGNGYRFRLDGSHIEYVWHGQVNPYGIAFDPLGNIYTADCHSRPAYSLLRGAYYPSFGKPHDGLGYGPEMIQHAHGSTSISGIAYYSDDQFPEEYRDRVFMGNSVTGRVNSDKVTHRGSSLIGIEKPDFVTCDDRWFRPVEIKLGPDGALYIADFYDCIIGYYEVPLTHARRDKTRGRIWRVVYRGDDDARRKLRKVDDLALLALEELWDRLAAASLPVRMSATHEIIDRFGQDGAKFVRTRIERPCQPTQRAHGLWILERLNALDDNLIGRLAGDDSRLVRVHLVKALAERSDWNSGNPPPASIVRARLFDSDPFVRRAAADALGRHPEAINLPELMRLWDETAAEDTYLTHTVRMAVRDHLKRPEIFRKHAGRDHRQDETKRLLDVILGVRNSQAAAFVMEALKADQYDVERLGELVHFATRYANPAQVDAVAQYVLTWQNAETAVQLDVFRSFGLATIERGGQIPEPFYAWAELLAEELIASSDVAMASDGMKIVRALRLGKLYETAVKVAESSEQPSVLRVDAMQALATMDDPRRLKLLDGVLGDLSEDLAVRRGAADALATINSSEARELLLARLLTAHHRLAFRIAAALAGTPQGAELLLTAISDGKASPLLLRELAVLHRLEAARLADSDERVAELTENLPPQDELIAELIAERRQAYTTTQTDANRGEELFTKECRICHLLENEGSKFGPDLDGIGVRGLDRLLEDLLDPNRNVDPAFQTTIVITDDGLTQTGLALRDEGQVLLLVDTQGKELRISHDTIEERFSSPLSPMPPAAEKTMTEEELSHVIRFLLDRTVSGK